MLYIRHRYGRENYPLLLGGIEQGRNVKLYEFSVLPDAVVTVRDQIGTAMKESGCPDRLINRTIVIFEELFMLIADRNPGRTVHAECAVEIGESIRLVTKDDGQILDLTDADSRVSSLRAYALSNMLGAHTTRRVHSLALSYNHNALEIR